ncbi:MAG TPA: hypothetical protein VMR28_01970 [Candidatus Saccharimonadales bacterium]|nr:hypothetical protein [Candidatus Saccharimonadales bacterium]
MPNNRGLDGYAPLPHPDTVIDRIATWRDEGHAADFDPAPLDAVRQRIDVVNQTLGHVAADQS